MNIVILIEHNNLYIISQKSAEMMELMTKLMTKLKQLYEHHYKKLMLIPILILLLAFLQIGFQTITTGDFVHKGITLKGGSTVTMEYSPALIPKELENFLRQQFPGTDLMVRTISSTGKIISLAVDSDIQEEEELPLLLQAIEEKTGLQKESFSVEVVGPSLGESFFRQTIAALLVAFLLMGIVVLIYFRTFIPSIAVILAAFSDIVVTLAIFNLTGWKLSSAGVAAFLFLVGYSVDSDILLTSRVLRRKEGTVMERIFGAMKTGLMMTTTTLVAVLAGLLFVQSEVVQQIMFILLVGLLADIPMTYIQNAGILLLYFEWKQKRRKDGLSR